MEQEMYNEQWLYRQTILGRIRSTYFYWIDRAKFKLMTLESDASELIRFDKNKKQYIASKPPELVLTVYGDSILRLAVSYLHNISDGEDILQDTLIKYIEKKPEFKSDQHEKAWLLRVAGNLSKNKIKHNNVRRSSPLEDEIIYEDNKDLKFVWEAVKDLPVKYREVIHLFYHEGYQTSEIGLLLDKKESTVRSLLHRGRKVLKETLREVYDFDE